MGKMIDAQIIVVASVATHQEGNAAAIFKAVFWPQHHARVAGGPARHALRVRVHWRGAGRGYGRPAPVSRRNSMKPSVKRQFDLRRDFVKSIGSVVAPPPGSGPRGRRGGRSRDRRDAGGDRPEREDGLEAVGAEDHRPACRSASKAPMTCPLIRIDTNQDSSATAKCATARRRRMR